MGPAPSRLLLGEGLCYPGTGGPLEDLACPGGAVDPPVGSAAPLSLKQVALQGGGYVRATDVNGLLISDLDAVPFEYTLSTRTVPGTPIRAVTLTTRATALTDRQLAQVDRQLGSTPVTCRP